MVVRIQRLSPILANQIAAGEVIERPASVVKELLENALDANATTIHIEIDFGGLNVIRMIDDGQGIVADDLPLAVSAHATSKIRELSDLFSVQSMGFRGEALASIAAVSRLTINSKPHDQAHAVQLHCTGGEISAITPCARNRGTTVEVRDLFYNAPVRKKFLKSERCEFQAIETVVKRFALTALSTALTLTHNGKVMYRLPAATNEQLIQLRIRKILGKSFLEQSVYLEVAHADLRLSGWVSGLSYQVSQSDKQWVYVNQRMVRDKLIQHAIKQAYDGSLSIGKYPACLLYLHVPAAMVDVNVHPTKHELRFQQPRLIHDFISRQVTAAIETPLTHASDALDIPQSQPMPFMMQERYIKQPIKEVATFRMPNSMPWFALNSQFALIFCQNVPYVVDVSALYRARLVTLLREVSELSSRPLLVPVLCAIEKTADIFFEEVKSLLAVLGIEMNVVDALHVMVRTIPINMPQLDIQKFIRNIQINRVTTLAEITEVLLDCQVIDAMQLSLEEQQILQDFFESQWSVQPDTVFYAIALDVAQCQQLLRIRGRHCV